MVSRRDFLAMSAVAAAAGTESVTSASPVQKKAQSPKQAQKLTALLHRTEPEVVHGPDLQFIGMPVGGLFAGTLYLGGDGQLWNWDIFNQHHLGTVAHRATFMGDSLGETDGANYVDPPKQQSPFQQSFLLHTDDADRKRIKFGKVAFRGEYPVGRVTYKQANEDVEMELEAFSPFCPLDVDSSSFPATTLTYRVKNVGKKAASYRLGYFAENPVLNVSKRQRADLELMSSVTATGGRYYSGKPKNEASPNRPDFVFENWSSGTYHGWTSSGTAFGTAPRKVKDLPSYMGNVNAGTEYVVNSHNTRSGEDVGGGDSHIGRLTSQEFSISRNYIQVRIGGGGHLGKTCVNLLVDSKIVASVTGRNNNAMAWESMNVAAFQGKKARLEVVDDVSGPWGNISLGEVIFSDNPGPQVALESLQDFGTFCVEVIGTKPQLTDGSIEVPIKLAPGETKEITFVIAWHFPNTSAQLPGRKNWYASKWKDASAVASEIRTRWPELRKKTLDWNKTWYDSTLPHWFLNRTFINTCTLATTTCHRFADGRFYFWEGIGCCAGTCTHVWGYAQAIGRVFPEVERYLREKIDFGMAFHADRGAIDYRAEYHQIVAHDGQCGCILRAYREHQMSPSMDFLKRIWPQVKRATEFLINEDPNKDGIWEGAQYNTLDAAWWGKNAWLSSLYIAALRASEAMATEMHDSEFASKCKAIAESGSELLVKDLFNGEYFIHIVDKAHPESNNTNNGCHIDQMFGQSWAMQVGLPRVVPKEQAMIALKSLYKYSFQTDIWDYRRRVKGIPGGRWYATPGEAGLIMCSYPKGGEKESIGKGSDAWAVGYFNECMSGFEYQVAAHMIAEGMVEEGLNLVKAIHDRYAPSKRNPYNEIECSDHYGRAMASYGAYVAITGFQLHGPSHKMSFKPLTGKSEFRCAFINEQGWGTYSRDASGKESVEYKHRLG